MKFKYRSSIRVQKDDEKLIDKLLIQEKRTIARKEMPKTFTKAECKLFREIYRDIVDELLEGRFDFYDVNDPGFIHKIRNLKADEPLTYLRKRQIYIRAFRKVKRFVKKHEL